MNDKLFTNDELRQLPVNCALYMKVSENGETELQQTNSFPKINSAYHQNNEMVLFGGFNKSITRRISPLEDETTEVF